MKKVFCIMLLVITSALTIVSCTEEQVAPKTDPPLGGGGFPGKI